MELGLHVSKFGLQVRDWYGAMKCFIPPFCSVGISPRHAGIFPSSFLFPCFVLQIRSTLFLRSSIKVIQLAKAPLVLVSYVPLCLDNIFLMIFVLDLCYVVACP